MARRVVVTGVGVITPIGSGKEAFFEGLSSGRNGIARISAFDASNFRSQMAGEVRDFNPEDFMGPREAYRMDRFAQFAVAAAKLALSDAGLTVDPGEAGRIGVMMGCGIGGIDTFQKQTREFLDGGPKRVSPFFVPMIIPNMASGQVALAVGARGPNTTVVTACASATHAIGDAFRAVAYGEADVMLAGGAEAAITPLGLAGFCSLRALSRRNDEPERAMRPFDRERDGFVMGEGSGVLILEELTHARARGARIYAEVMGYGRTCDAHHIIEPAPDGSGAAAAMAVALRDGGVAPQDVDYVNAHGTSTILNDKTETMAIKQVFGEHAKKLAISSTKSMTGHLLGAAGAVEAVACIFAISEGIIPPTINYENPDPECDLDYVPNQARRAHVRVAMSNSFGFGGHNGVIVFGKPGV